MLATTEIITDDYVRAELRHAFITLAYLPENALPRGLRLMNSPKSSRAQEFVPTAGDVSRMDIALQWLELLGNEDRDVRLAVPLRAQDLTLRQAAAAIGNISAPTVAKREARGIAVIVAGLRGMKVLQGFDTLARRAA